ncbi:MAG: hypothetical protein IJC50_00860 [Clostridia bacterium]|nr:hypothetical protein [Clostridia bacterium]
MFNNKAIKFISALLVLVMLLSSFAACGAKDEPDDSPDTAESSIKTGTADDSPADVISLKSEHYTINNEMFAFYFYKDYYDAVDRYYDSYFYYYNLDPTKDLKEQQYSESQTTWFDYFITVTYKNIVNYLTFAEAAIAEGVELEAEDIELVDNELASLRSAAEEQGITVQEFLDRQFGYGVTEDTVRECIEIYTLGDKYYNSKVEELNVYDDDDFDAYYEEHKDEFLFIDFRKTEIRADQQTYASEEEKQVAYADAEKIAQNIADSKDIAEFVEKSVSYYKSINDSLEEPLTDDEIYAQATNVTVQYSYRNTTGLGKWAFVDERKSGDMTVLDNGAGIYTAIYLDSAPYRAENATKNYRQVAFALADYENDKTKAKTAAEELYNEWISNGGDGTEFEKIAESKEIYSAYLREEVDLGETQPIVENWLFNKEHKAGDSEIIEDESYVYVVLYEGEGEISWKVKARETLLNNALNEYFTESMEKYPIDFNLENMKLLSGVTAFTEVEE